MSSIDQGGEAAGAGLTGIYGFCVASDENRAATIAGSNQGIDCAAGIAYRAR